MRILIKDGGGEALRSKRNDDLDGSDGDRGLDMEMVKM